MGGLPEVSVVIPCYRSGPWLGELAGGITRTLDGRDYEIVFVNDGSPDQVTWKAIKSLASTEPSVVGIDLARNSGQFAALMAGLATARGDVVITMDDDLQHPPEEIPKLLAGLDDDTDVVIGSYASKAHGTGRNAGSRLMDLIYRRSYGKPRDLRLTSFRAIRRPVVEAMLSFRTARPIPGAMILQTTSRIKNVEVEHHPRPHESSGYSLRRLVSSTLDNVIYASAAPLRAISALGLFAAAAAALLLLYYLFTSLVGNRAVPGFATTVLLITFFGGASLLAIGVVGEYMTRVVTEVARPPLYVVRTRVGGDQSENGVDGEDREPPADGDSRRSGEHLP